MALRQRDEKIVDSWNENIARNTYIYADDQNANDWAIENKS